MTLVDALHAEFTRRRALNPRYSLRAFSGALGTSHSSLSRLARGRPPSARAIATLGRRLGWSEAAIGGAVARRRVDQLHDLAAQPGFIADLRWVAARTGQSLDQVQVALHDAVRTRRIAMSSAHVWTVEE